MNKIEPLLRWAKEREDDFLWHLSWNGTHTLCGKGKANTKLQWWLSLHSVQAPPQPVGARCGICGREIATKLGLIV